jgi:hypothetical protein
MDGDAVANVPDRQLTAAAGQHMNLDTSGRKLLSEPADMPAEAAFDYGRVLPRDQQGTHR